MKYWAELQPYRAERLRCKNYTYGNQWNDIITTPEGQRMTEETYIREQGSSPLKNNLIRRIVRNVLGVFRNNYSLPKFSELKISAPEEELKRMENLYTETISTNSLGEIYTRVLEEYLIGGMAVVRKRLSGTDGGQVITDMVRPDSFFFNTDSVDPRGWDINAIGEIHTVRTDDRGNIRIIEYWEKERDGWHYHFIEEDGTERQSGRSPLPWGGHPYVMKAYPFIDGEIHSFVADCIDQQRYINRLITLNDWIIRSSAKGVLLFPESAIPDDLELDDIACQWSRYNGVIRYKSKAGVPVPQQVNSNTSNIGISELLEVQLKMMEDVSGVNSALQGQLSSGAISGTLYEQQTRQALTGLADILEGFRSFILESARKDAELIKITVG